ncbi:PREDICTED: mitochondrial-processing peptidase subunit beta-like [Eufriesea mexicana]|uniref:mitochondrial-processing peptidase subunit beta-like n=1 Tax=Eufriesea mexicana TaxID=516756 RepID=UPI00083C11F7|nr:PREDICTED: mitochondrial-processing peptidase subunit beta-like [Eufriesea mexicana]
MSKVLNTYSNIESSTEFCYLNNGMRLVCECRESFTTTIGCFIPAGAMYEMPEERGSVLFLEHLLFRKTKSNNQQQLETMLEEIGGKIVTIAMRDIFLFYGTVLSCKIDKLIQLFADVILNGIIYDKDITEEKCVILQELLQMESNKEKVVMDYLPSIAYQDTALGNSVYPNTNIIKNFSTKNLIEFHNRLFQTCYMTIVSTGSICLKELQRIVCQHFRCNVEDYKSSFAIFNKMQSCKRSFEYRFSAAELRLRDDDNDLGYVAIGIEGSSYKQREDHIALSVAKQVIGAWDKTYSGGQHNAPFIAHFAFNTNLCYMYKSFFCNWAQSTSIWGCYFVCDKLCLMSMIHMLQKEWMKLCTTITEKEVLRAVNQCITNDLIILNNPTNRFFDIVENVFRSGCYEPIEHRIVEYKKITADKIREVSTKYIYDQSPVVIALGRIENMPDYSLIRNGLYLLRY